MLIQSQAYLHYPVFPCWIYAVVMGVYWRPQLCLKIVRKEHQIGMSHMMRRSLQWERKQYHYQIIKNLQCPIHQEILAFTEQSVFSLFLAKYADSPSRWGKWVYLPGSADWSIYYYPSNRMPFDLTHYRGVYSGKSLNCLPLLQKGRFPVTWR